jgi:UDP-glucose:(heptosyl)LPS alpha-1,3-glucosyltransferase
MGGAAAARRGEVCYRCRHDVRVARSRSPLMRLAIIRQRYTPFGGAERFVEGALEALLERDVAITLYTREWPETRLRLIEPHIVDPPYAGSLWRDMGFARAVAREIGRARLDPV